MRAVLLSLGLFATACATDADPDVDEVEVGEDDDGKADAASELYVRTGETSLWVTKQIARRDSGNGPAYVLRGRTSRTITDGSGFVFDDPYGDFANKSARTFEVTWPVATARTLADGTNQFVRLHFTPSTGRPTVLTARAVVRPRLVSFTGASSLYLTAELTPVVLGGTVVYRLKGRATSAITSLAVTAGTQSLTDVRILPDNRFEIDLQPDHVFDDVPVNLRAVLGNGQVATKTTRVGLSLKKLGLTAEDAYDKWPRPECTTSKRSCLTGLPSGALDLAACGEAIEVLVCAGQVGVFVDDIAFVAALDDGRARTATPAFKADAKALVGAARADSLQFGAEQSVEARLQPLFGRWYLGTAARTIVLASAVDAGILAAYTHPLDLVEPTVPVPNNTAVARHVAADALLLELARYDFVHSEFGRSYAEIVNDNRAQHVTSIKAFRETIAVEPHYSNAAWDVMVGDWLVGPYVEVSLDRATGAAALVFIEID